MNFKELLIKSTIISDFFQRNFRLVISGYYYYISFGIWYFKRYNFNMSRLGCMKDKFDGRDYLMRAYLPLVKLPAKVDYTAKLSPVRHQGDEGTCVGFATATGMKEYQEKLDYEKLILLSPRYV
jgi:hypothetical protein